MFDRAWRLGLVAALVALALGGAAFAVASGGGAHAQTFEVFDPHRREPQAALERLAATPHRLLHGVCTVVSEQTAHCVETAHLRGKGTLEGSGDINDSAGHFKQALTGGTGRYAGADGQFPIHQVNENDSIVTVEITG